MCKKTITLTKEQFEDLLFHVAHSGRDYLMKSCGDISANRKESYNNLSLKAETLLGVLKTTVITHNKPEWMGWDR